MNKIIGFCGRMRSGKGELANICEKYGYKKMSFAIPLKRLCAELLDLSMEGLNEAKNNKTEIAFTFDEDACEFLAVETEIPIDAVKTVCLNKKIDQVRELLQFIGTDLIRGYNANWHVERIREMIEPEQKYVFDDVRFPNEKNLLEELGGDCWFVIRPTLDNVSNHESETALKFKDCWDKIIINDSTLFKLQFKWDIFMSNYDASIAKRNELYNTICTKGLNKETEDELSLNDYLFLNRVMFKEHFTPIETPESYSLTDDGKYRITFQDDWVIETKNPFTIEALKMYIHE